VFSRLSVSCSHPVHIATSAPSSNIIKEFKMVGLKFLATAVALVQGAFASPVEPTLAKRGEGIHLFNCRPIGGAGVAQTWISIVVVRRQS
jgi:hypothetical protein